MSAPLPERRRLSGDRVLALLVVMLSLPTIAWLVATDESVPPPAAEPVAAVGDHGSVHGSMHDDAMHESMHDDAMHESMHDDAPEPGDAAGGTTAAPADADATIVRMNEFSFDMPLTYKAGTITFEVINEGVAPHEFALGAVGDHHSHIGQTEWMDGGTTTLLTVDLEPGSYEVGCHVPGHYEAGMKATITVTG